MAITRALQSVGRSNARVARLAAAAVACALTVTGCQGARWRAGSSLLAPSHRVAEALGDPSPVNDVDPTSYPLPAPPHQTRPCCAFGMDLHVNVASVELPLYSIGNLLSPDETGHHEYDNGAATIGTDLRRILSLETNGLVYTCRGGWVDVAHVRDNADMTVFLALWMVRDLARGTTIELPGDGARRRIVVDPVPADVLARHALLDVAITLASWTAWRLSIWHELATWWGWESTPGFSERLSAFSLEDLYSNVLGARIGGGVLRDSGFRSRDDYDRQMEAWIPEALRRLQAQPAAAARGVMHSLDGRWWDSHRRVPDVHLVTRRSFPFGGVVTPWRAQDAFDDDQPPVAVRPVCAVQALPLGVPDQIDALVAANVVHIEWRPEGWAGASFPFRDPAARVVRSDELDAVVAATHADMERVLGAGFDRPRGPIAMPLTP